MIRIRGLIRFILEPRIYIWVDVTPIRETPKAILILFDGQKAWIPKAWICRIKLNRGRTSPPKAGEAISINISGYHWAKKV